MRQRQLYNIAEFINPYYDQYEVGFEVGVLINPKAAYTHWQVLDIKEVLDRTFGGDSEIYCHQGNTKIILCKADVV